jgi:hypothetical protein
LNDGVYPLGISHEKILSERLMELIADGKDVGEVCRSYLVEVGFSEDKASAVIEGARKRDWRSPLN